MIVDCAHYVDGSRQSDRTISLDEAALQIYQGGFVWLGMFEPSGEELDEVKYAFGLHELAVEDAKSFHLRPKVEEYESGVQLGSRPTVRPSMPSRRKPVPGASTRPQPAPRAVNRWIDGLEDSLRPRRAPAPQMSGGARFAAGDGAAAQSVCGAANLGCVGGAPVGSGIDGPVL